MALTGTQTNTLRSALSTWVTNTASFRTKFTTTQQRTAWANLVLSDIDRRREQVLVDRTSTAAEMATIYDRSFRTIIEAATTNSTIRTAVRNHIQGL